MNIQDPVQPICVHCTSAIENDFPIRWLSQIAARESWRKEINRPLYHIHKWWATRLGSVFRAITLAALAEPGTDIRTAFYTHHDFADKIVLDPFMGSGTTLGESAKLGAKAIGCDINPVSTFLVQQAFSPVSEGQLRSAFAKLEKTVAQEIRQYYQTLDPQSGKRIPVLYFFWVKIVRSPGGEIIPLFSRYIFAQDAYPQKKPKAQMICPRCWQIKEGRYDATHTVCTVCGHQYNPQQGPVSGRYVVDSGGNRYRIKDLVATGDQPPEHRLYALLALREDGEKIYLPAREEDFMLFAQAQARLHTEELSLPTMRVRSGHNTDQARGYNYHHWRDFFNARQLLCLGLLLRAVLEIEDRAIQEQLLCLFSGVLEFNNLFCSYKGEGTGAVRHMFSNHILKPERTPLENSVWGNEKSSGTFSTLFESRLIRARQYLEQPFELALQQNLFGDTDDTFRVIASDPIRVQKAASWEDLLANERSVWIVNGDSAHLPLPPRSVDAVVTDPPYFDFVHYSELSDFFFAWLAPVLKDRYPWFDKAHSGASGEVQHSDPLIFARQLTRVFTECHRVLKDQGVLVFSFHHSRPEGWAAIYQAVFNAGFAIVAAHPVHAELRAASPKSQTSEPISVDAILVCKKSGTKPHSATGNAAIAHYVKHQCNELIGAGIELSNRDRFVITAAQVLVGLRGRSIDFDSLCDLITQQYEMPSPANLESR